MARRPSPGNRSDQYGWRIHPITGNRQFHYGEDIGWLGGLTLVAPSGGTVVAYGWQGGWGKRLDFLGDDGVLHYLAHTEELLANVGEWYPEGSSLAQMGATGNVEGVHVHWETRPDGGATIDPEEWLALASAHNNSVIDAVDGDEDDMPDSMFAYVDGVPSWCWLNWATGTLYAVHNQSEGDWIQAYMGPVRFNWWGNDMGGEYYKNKLALFGILCPTVKIKGSSLTADDLAKIQKMLDRDK